MRYHIIKFQKIAKRESALYGLGKEVNFNKELNEIFGLVIGFQLLSKGYSLTFFERLRLKSLSWVIFLMIS